MNPLTEAQAEDLGREDRLAGKPNAPFANPVIESECSGAKVGTKTHLLRAYNHGWHSAHAQITDAELRDEGIFDPRRP